MTIFGDYGSRYEIDDENLDAVHAIKERNRKIKEVQALLGEVIEELGYYVQECKYAPTIKLVSKLELYTGVLDIFTREEREE